MWRLVLAALAVSAIWHLPVPGQQPNEAEKLFRAMEKKLGSAKTLQLRFETNAESTPEPGKFKGTLVLAEGNKARIEINAELNGKKGVFMKATSDGTNRKVLGEGPASGKTPQKHNENILASLQHGGFMAAIYLGSSDADGKTHIPVYKASDFKLGNKEKVGQRQAQIIEYQLTWEKAPKFSETLWIDLETQLPLKRVFSGSVPAEKIKFKISETYSDFVLDAKLDAATFQLPK